MLADSSLIGRRIGSTETWVVASPDYLARAPVPQHPDDLRAHRNIRDSNAAVATRASFVIDGQQVSVPLPGQITVNSAAALRQLALHGKGVAIIPRFMVAQDVAQGRLIRVLAQFGAPSVPHRSSSPASLTLQFSLIIRRMFPFRRRIRLGSTPAGHFHPAQCRRALYPFKPPRSHYRPTRGGS